MSETGIRWTTVIKNVDIETGEQITEADKRRYYNVIKQTTYATTNRIKTRGIIERTNLCQRKSQLELNFGAITNT